MKYFVFIAFSFFFFQKNLLAQPGDDTAPFEELMAKGKTAFENGDYKLCAECYSNAGDILPQKYRSHYNASRCYILNKKIKKGHKKLVQAIRADWEDVETWMEKDEADFKNLKKKKRCWKKIQKEFKSHQSGLNMALRNQLIQMEIDDQKYRKEIQKLSSQPEQVGEEISYLWEKQNELDQKNLIEAEKIIAQYGFPNKNLIGKEPRKTLFLIIQHAPLEYQEKYFPIFKEAANDGDLEKSTLALLQDRIEMRNGRPQIFGTQVSQDPKTGKLFFESILDERNVNKRRAAIGLPPLAEYAKRFDFEYKFQPQILTKKEFEKLAGRWDLVNVKDAITLESKFEPQQKIWVEFSKDGDLDYNLDVNTCSMQFRATDKGRLIMSAIINCTKACCDDLVLQKQLNYQNVIKFEIYDTSLFLMDTKQQIFEFKKGFMEKRIRRE